MTIFPIKERTLKRWPERGQRKRRWFKGKDAAALVDSKGLQQAIRSLSER